jgi:hypothetical protein
MRLHDRSASGVWHLVLESVPDYRPQRHPHDPFDILTSAAEKTGRTEDPQAAYLHYLENQREELKKAVLQAPCHRLDNLASFVETHGERLSHFLEGMISYRKKARMFRVKSFFSGLAARWCAARPAGSG